MGHVLQSSLVPRRTILLKAGTETISELEVTKCTAVCYLFRMIRGVAGVWLTHLI